jgi:ribosomal 30S subunit maturation factor RimM
MRERGISGWLVRNSEREMKEMMKNLGKYVRKKKLEVNVEKTKIMRKRSAENEWNCEGRKIKRINEFKYLGYTFNERAHIREIVRKANKVVGCVWGIEERKKGGG